MTKIRIFVEGEADEKFLGDYLHHLKLVSGADIKIVSIGGWTNLPKVVNKFREFTDAGYKNLVIFDADSNFSKRKIAMNKKKIQLNIQFELFLFPNDKEGGALESLLLKICNPNHQNIFTCLNKYKDCLKVSNKEYIYPDDKGEVFAFLEALGKETKDNKRNFLDEVVWDLDHQYLNPLKTFLKKFIK